MKRKLPTVVLALAFALLTVQISAALASKPLSITNLGTFGGTSSSAADVNNQGQVVGSFSNNSGSFAFVWTAKDGKTDLANLLSTQIASSAMAINNKGQIIGTCTTPNLNYDPTLPTPRPPQYLSHAVLWTNKNTVVALEPSSVVESSVATDISSDGTVVGYTLVVYPPAPPTRTYYSTGPGNAFIWTIKTGMTIIPIPLADFGAAASIASGINSKGQVVGSLQKPGATGLPVTYCAFIWSAKEGTQLIPLPEGTPESAVNSASDINEEGQVVGMWSESLDVNAARHGFVWTAKDGMTELPILPDATYGTPIDIGNNDQIVGICTTPAPTPPPYYPPVYQRGFLWATEKGIMELPPLSGDTASIARGISENGQVAGASTRYELVYDADGNYLNYRSYTTAVVWDT